MWKQANAPSDMCLVCTPNYFILHSLALLSNSYAPLQIHVHHLRNMHNISNHVLHFKLMSSYYVQQSVCPQGHMSRIKQQAAVLHGKLQLAVPIITESLMSAASDNTPEHSGFRWCACYSLIKHCVAHHRAFL
jgi:hypothetical protein